MCREREAEAGRGGVAASPWCWHLALKLRRCELSRFFQCVEVEVEGEGEGEGEGGGGHRGRSGGEGNSLISLGSYET